MKILNNIMESVLIKARHKVTSDRSDLLEEREIYINLDDINGYGIDGTKRVMEFLGEESYDKIKQGSSIRYLFLARRMLNMSKYAYDFLTTSETELFLDQLLDKGIEPYLKYPEAEREKRWYKDWYMSPIFLKLQNLGLDYILNDWYKENLKFKGTATLVEIPELEQVFNGMDHYFVCEEMKIIIMIEMMPVYSKKEMDVTLYADFENSPYFNDKYITDDAKLKAEYWEDLNKMAKKVGQKEMNQKALLNYIEKRKKYEKIEIRWDLRGAKHSTRRQGSLSHQLKTMEDRELAEILSSYIICPVELMYKPFYNYVDTMFHKFNTSTPAGNHCEFNQNQTLMGSKKEFEERLNSSGYITDYFGTDKTKIYDYTIE